MPEITKERLRDMEDSWNFETSDPTTQEWRDDLTPEEAKIVADWDGIYTSGLRAITRDIMVLYREGERNG